MSAAHDPASFQHIAAELRLYSGEDCLGALARELRRNGSRRAVAVSGRSVAASDAMVTLRAALGPLLAGECHRVQSNSPVSAVKEVASALKAHDADAVIAIGGGSAAVTARAASILLAEAGEAADLCTRRLASGEFVSPRLDAPKLPQFVVATTPSNGFVKAGSAMHDDVTGQRMAMFDPKTRARAVFLHPQFLRTAPASLVLSASLNTLSTTIEALESPRCDPISEAMLAHALRLTSTFLHRVQPGDALARERLCVAGVLCGRGTEQAGGGLASVLAHAIGHRVHASNGLVNAIVLPHTMRFNELLTRQHAARIGQGLGASHGGGTALQQGQAPDPVPALESLLDTLEIPRRLRDIGLSRDALPDIANNCFGDWFIGRSVRPVKSTAEVLAILEAAW